MKWAVIFHQTPREAPLLAIKRNAVLRLPFQTQSYKRIEVKGIKIPAEAEFIIISDFSASTYRLIYNPKILISATSVQK